MLDVDFQSYLASLTGTTVQENLLSEDKTNLPRVWWQRSEGNVDLLLSGATALARTIYDVEVSALDVDAAASTADTIKTTLNGYAGAMGSSRVLAAFVQDQADDYVPKSLDADEGFHVFAFTVEILT